MNKAELLSKVKKGSFTNEQLVSWIECLPGSSGNRKPTLHKVGDVFKHPYVLLKKSKNDWVCTLLTSENNCDEILEPANSRFFGDNYITKSLFTVKNINGSFYGVYDNNKHLKEVYTKLIHLFI